MTTIPCVNQETFIVDATDPANPSYVKAKLVDLGVWAKEIGFDHENFPAEIIKRARSAYLSTTPTGYVDRVISYNLVMVCDETDEEFLNEIIGTTLSVLGSWVRRAVNENSTLTESFRNGFLEVVEEKLQCLK